MDDREVYGVSLISLSLSLFPPRAEMPGRVPVAAAVTVARTMPALLDVPFSIAVSCAYACWRAGSVSVSMPSFRVGVYVSD